MGAKLTIQHGADPAGDVEGLLQRLRERQNILSTMKAAILRNDETGALEGARALTGIATGCPNVSVQRPAAPTSSPQQMDPSEDTHELRLNVTQGLLDVVMEIGRERSKIELAMRAALVRDDEREALALARELTGLPTRWTGQL